MSTRTMGLCILLACLAFAGIFRYDYHPGSANQSSRIDRWTGREIRGIPRATTPQPLTLEDLRAQGQFSAEGQSVVEMLNAGEITPDSLTAKGRAGLALHLIAIGEVTYWKLAPEVRRNFDNECAKMIAASAKAEAAKRQAKTPEATLTEVYRCLLAAVLAGIVISGFFDFRRALRHRHSGPSSGRLSQP